MKLNDISLNYGEKKVFDNFNVEFGDNEITCVLGASGCGKTTLLNIIAEIVPYKGKVEKKSENIGYIFQNPLLFDHLTIEKNIELVLKNKIKDKNERKVAAENILKKVGLLEERKNYPKSLSGGMAQRVSLARAFACETDILLMDEPFKGLDISLKKSIIALFSDLYKSYPKTVVLVTHDIDEAILLADRIIVLGNNEVLYNKQLDKAEERSIGDYSEVRKDIYAVL